MKATVMVALIGMLWCVSPARSDVSDDDRKMEGTWVPETAELGGKPLPEDTLKAIKLTLKDGKYTVVVGKGTDEGVTRVDATKKPATLDIKGTQGPNKGKTFLAIYEVSGDTLTVCYDLSGKARPTEFKSRPQTQLFLVTYKRQKP